MELEVSFTSPNTHIFIHVKKSLLTLSVSPVLWSFLILRVTLKSDKALEVLITGLKSQVMCTLCQAWY